MAFAPRVLLLLCGISGLFSAVLCVATVPVPCCPPGWVRWRDTCYIFQDTEVNYTQAVEACNNLTGAYLAPIHDSVEDALARQLIFNSLGSMGQTWIGRHDGLTEGDFVLIDGEKSKFENFQTGQPDDFLSAEDCVEINQFGLWNDDGCGDNNYYLCAKDLWWLSVWFRSRVTRFTFPTLRQVPYKRMACFSFWHIYWASSIKTAKMEFALQTLVLLCGISGLVSADCDNKGSYCPKGWTQLDDYCYTFVEQQRTFMDAEEICILKGGNLMSVLDHKESVLAKELIYAALGDTSNTQDTWIGAHDGIEEGTFMWTDGSAFDFMAFQDTQPDNFNGVEDCVEIDGGTLLWNDDNCTDENFFLCAKEAHEH
ncbi:C-type mannose receptor 2-like [Stigmatopora argus]